MASSRILSSMRLQRGGPLLGVPAGTEIASPGSYFCILCAQEGRSTLVRIYVASFAFSAGDPTVPGRGAKGCERKHNDHGTCATRPNLFVSGKAGGVASLGCFPFMFAMPLAMWASGLCTPVSELQACPSHPFVLGLIGFALRSSVCDFHG